MFARSCLFLSALALTLSAQEPSFSTAELHGRDAYVLQNARMRVSALRGAGHIAEIRFRSDDPKAALNPMRVPHYPTIEPWEYDPAKHDAIYGGGTNRVLMSGYMGHLLNFPTFGGPSATEAANGLGNHGEALAREWTLDRAGATPDEVVLEYSAHLPLQRYNVGRRLTLPANEDVLYVEEWVESLVDFDRPAMWVQHVTFGAPFVEAGKTTLDMSAGRGEIRRSDPTNSLAEGEVRWPEGRDATGSPTDLRVMQTKPGSGTYVGYLMDPDREDVWFTMFHPDYRVLIGYVWNREDFPWMGDWQENGRNQGPPWNGKARARGMEFGTTPFGGTMERVASEGDLWGRPTVRWIGGRQRETVRYLAFLLEVPLNFRGVADLQVRDGRILVVERGTAKRFEIEAGRRP